MKLIIEAFNLDELHPSRRFLARQAEIIIRSAAKVGINALVDEATGYIHDKRKDEYRQLFKQFIEEECRQWTKTKTPSSLRAAGASSDCTNS